MPERNKEGKVATNGQPRPRTEPPYDGAFHMGDQREIGRREIRCLHTDHTRAAAEKDRFEFHWRCPAWFIDEDSPYCPLHRGLYARESSHRLPTIEEKREIIKTLTPKAVAFLRAALPADSPILSNLPLSSTTNPWTGLDDKDGETPERLAAAAARKEALRQQAQQLTTQEAP